MVYLMEGLLSRSLPLKAQAALSEREGLGTKFQRPIPPRGGLVRAFRMPAPLPAWESRYLCWISDEGMLNPEVAHYRYQFPLERLLFLLPRSSQEAWRAAKEAVQTGLFESVFLFPSAPCAVGDLRKLQLLAEKASTWVFVLGPVRLPHWVFKNVDADSLPQAHCSVPAVG